MGVRGGEHEAAAFLAALKGCATTVAWDRGASLSRGLRRLWCARWRRPSGLRALRARRHRRQPKVVEQQFILTGRRVRRGEELVAHED
jgi:hypothetical protein